MKIVNITLTFPPHRFWGIKDWLLIYFYIFEVWFPLTFLSKQIILLHRGQTAHTYFAWPQNNSAITEWNLDAWDLVLEEKKDNHKKFPGNYKSADLPWPVLYTIIITK